MNPINRRYYPFEGHYYPINGHQMHILDEGDGEPIVMLHGNPTWSFYYREVVKVVRGAYRAIVPDYIGCGLSDKPQDDAYPYTLSRRIDDLEALLEALGLRNNLTLLVHDWGGMIGMGYATRYPERIRRLAILNTAAFHLPPGKPMPPALAFARRSLLGAYLNRRFNAFARITAMVGTLEHHLPKALRDAYCAPYDSWENRIALARFVQDIPLAPGDPAYDIVTQSQELLAGGAFQHIPAIIFWGMRDFVFDRHFLAEWIRYLPQAEVHRFEGAGHYVLEDAREPIIQRLVRWLKGHPLDG